MGTYNYFRASKPRHPNDAHQLQRELDAHLASLGQPNTNPSTDLITNNASSHLQAELNAHVVSIEQQQAIASVAHIDYSIDHWSLESTQTLPHVTWAPIDKFSTRPAQRTGRVHGHGYVRYDEAMILRPLTTTYQQLDHTKRQLA